MNSGLFKLIGFGIFLLVPFVAGLLLGGSWGTSMAEEDCECEQVEEVEEETSEAEDAEEGTE